MATDNLHSIDERVPMDPQDVSVQLNIKVPYHYREQLIRMAREAGQSLNRFCINSLIRSVPPERR